MNRQPPETLFKYVTPDRVDVLQDGVIRFTPPCAQNDPFELMPVFDSVLSADDLVTEVLAEGDPVERALREIYGTLSRDEQAQLPDFRDLLRITRSAPGVPETMRSMAPLAERSLIVSDP